MPYICRWFLSKDLSHSCLKIFYWSIVDIIVASRVQHSDSTLIYLQNAQCSLILQLSMISVVTVCHPTKLLQYCWLYPHIPMTYLFYKYVLPKSFLLHPQNKPMRMLGKIHMSPFYSRRKYDSKKSSDSPKVRQLKSSRARTPNHSF